MSKSPIVGSWQTEWLTRSHCRSTNNRNQSSLLRCHKIFQRRFQICPFNQLILPLVFNEAWAFIQLSSNPWFSKWHGPNCQKYEPAPVQNCGKNPLTSDWITVLAKFVLSVMPAATVGSVLFNICSSWKMHASMKDSAKCEVIFSVCDNFFGQVGEN